MEHGGVLVIKHHVHCLVIVNNAMLEPAVKLLLLPPVSFLHNVSAAAEEQASDDVDAHLVQAVFAGFIVQSAWCPLNEGQLVSVLKKVLRHPHAVLGVDISAVTVPCVQPDEIACVEEVLLDRSRTEKDILLHLI